MMRVKTLMMLLLFLGLQAWACSGGNEEGVNGDTDEDNEGESGGDSNGTSDGDSDSDSDTDGDSDSDSDTDVDSDSDADSSDDPDQDVVNRADDESEVEDESDVDSDSESDVILEEDTEDDSEPSEETGNSDDSESNADTENGDDTDSEDENGTDEDTASDVDTSEGGDTESTDDTGEDEATDTGVNTDGDDDTDSDGAGEPFKGVANSPVGIIEQLKVSWCYNWMNRPQATDCDDPLFVPMIWGGGDVAGEIAQIAADGYDVVLGFNEPNKSDQANMSVDEAIALWPTLTSHPEIRVGSPSVSDDGRAWLDDFMARVESEGLRVDFVTVHWYGWNAGSCDNANQLEGALNWAEKWGRPLWLTEWGCMHESNPNPETIEQFYLSAIEMFERHPLLERYAFYPWNTHNHLAEGDTLTPLGELFAAAPAYR